MIYLIISIIVVLFIVLIFSLIKKGNAVIYILTFLFLFVIGVISLRFYPKILNYINQKKTNVEKSKIEMVENYINSKYNGEYKVKKATFSYNGEGISGGLFMYNFHLKDNDGEKYIVSYTSYDDLSQNTLSKVEINKNE